MGKRVEPTNKVTAPPVPVPIIIPTAGIKPLPRPATIEEQGGKIKLEPIEGEQLQGFRCPHILDSCAVYEHCGKREPMDWLGRVAIRLSDEKIDPTIFAEFPQDYMDEMKPVPISCLALYPSEDGYIVCGGWSTRFVFRISGAWLMSRAVVELSAYQPLPRLIYDGSVVVEDYSEADFVAKLKDLIE